MTMDDHLRLESEAMPWRATDLPGVERKDLASPGATDRFTTALLRLAPGAHLPRPGAGLGQELFVLAGDYCNAAGELGEGGYVRQPPALASDAWTKTGCELFIKTCPFPIEDVEAVHSASGNDPWLPGQGNLSVKPLHHFSTEGTALVHWPAGERFLPHQHYGGEEILVLSGTFEDEHGRYPKGTWLRSPHLSAHHPFVVEETVILVKTGHLPPAQQ